MNGFWSVWSRKQNNTILFSTFSDSVRSQPHSEPERRMRGRKRSGSTEKISGGCSGPGTLFRSMIKFTVFPSLSENRSLPVFPELADRTEVLLNFIDIKQVQRRSEEPLSDPQYTGELKFLTVGRASEEKGYDIAVQITAELKKRGTSLQMVHHR